MSFFTLPAAALLLSSLLPSASAQVTATGTMGVTNPPAATLGVYNQTSESRLLSLNSYDDFCIFSPMTSGDTIGDTEETQVAWCTKPRNNARVIPDGTITGLHFVKTPLYVQVSGWGDLTKLNIQEGDEGGELDPHGATGNGNPVGGNVTSNVSGEDVSYEEWMNYVAYDSFCLRICTAENETYSAANECQHTFDLMGCAWVMPSDQTPDVFTSCDADAAYPPGVYPVGEAGSGTTSTFAQRYTGVWSDASTTGTYTIGYTVTPSAAFSTPASSNCVTYSSISNGLTDLAAGTASVTVNTAAGETGAASAATTAAATSGGVSGTTTAKATSTGTSATTGGSGANASAASSSAAATTGAASSASRSYGTGFPFIGFALTVGAGVLGAGALFL
ncbi:hypothetical protein BDY24DRAFT_384229 [Mrakia frigida]|uniref:uncharacterized protein n=1 Tax=Mrakia frigida TaxID=29902 RepID=UPI003FCC130C